MRFTWLIAALILCSGCGKDNRAQHELVVPWTLSGHSVRADLHTHTLYSDGRLSPDNLATRAALSGCDVLAITDHSDSKVKSATPEFFAEIDELRGKAPNLILLTGLEWNVPPYNGREHVNLIVDPAVERKLLPEFKAQFERGSEAVSAEPALEWLARSSQKGQVALFYNHPLRHAASNPERVEKDLKAWHLKNGLLIGFEGAPGHQGSAKIGNYSGQRLVMDRWDPTSAQVGGVWDRLLAQGMNLWGAMANSDYHNDRWDKEPCSFSETVLQVPERSHKGVLQALHAGTFWASHGRFLRQLWFTVHAAGLEVPAGPGEVIRYRPNADVSVRVVVERSTGASEHALAIELIGNCRNGKPESIATEALAAGQREIEIPLRGLTLGEDGSSCYLRIRVRNARDDGDLLAYSNPIRIRLADRRSSSKP